MATRRGRKSVRSRHGYPRPQLVREHFHSLDGPWEFAIDRAGEARIAQELQFSQRIEVPFAPETPASGIGEKGFFRSCWYRRTFQAPMLQQDERRILHFGAVDYEATVWLNDRLAVRHEGGYTPFSADITDLLLEGKQQQLVVRAEDDPHDLSKPRGKQDWQEQPHSIWYPRTTGIWQPVWMERVNETHIARIRWTADVEKWQIALRVDIVGPQRDRTKLRVRLRAGDRMLADDLYNVIAAQVARTICLPDPGIDDARRSLLWSVHHPNLIDAELELLDESDRVIDSVASYTAMRSVAARDGRVEINGASVQLQLVLDQGYWPETGLTGPDDEAYRRDVELVKSLGFNGVRKHQKIESPRFLYWADKLGLLVWEEMPSAYTFSDRTMKRLVTQWAEAIERDVSHPCIIAWVPLNESWGMPDLPRVPEQRDAQRAMYHLTRALDPTRPVVANDGWEACLGDIICVHDYEADPKRLVSRYASDVPAEKLLRRERPAGRAILLDEFHFTGQPIVLSEFGGIAYARDAKQTWGYTRAKSARQLGQRVRDLIEIVKSIPMFAGFCYTQFADTYQEANGLVYMDRKPKFPRSGSANKNS